MFKEKVITLTEKYYKWEDTKTQGKNRYLAKIKILWEEKQERWKEE